MSCCIRESSLYARTVDRRAHASCISGAVLGADGFGMADEEGRWLKVPQVGRVVVGADVEIGANTTIDRGAHRRHRDRRRRQARQPDPDRAQLPHRRAHRDCRLRRHRRQRQRIGRNCQIGGAAMIAGHLDIADGTVISAATGVFDIDPRAGRLHGAFPALPHREWQHVASVMRRLRSFADARPRARATTSPERRENERGEMDINEIMRHLPHRPPFPARRSRPRVRTGRAASRRSRTSRSTSRFSRDIFPAIR